MKFKEGWEETIRNKLGCGKNVVVTDINGDVDFCEEVFGDEVLWFTSAKEVQLIICKECIIKSFIDEDGWYKKHYRNKIYDISKKEFLNLVEERV